MGCCALIRPIRSRSFGQTELLETVTACPVCGISFTTNDTYKQLATHIQHCLRLQPVIRSLQEVPENTALNRVEEEKIKRFRELVQRKRVPWSESNQVFTVNREKLIEESLERTHDFTSRDFHKEFAVMFEGESGLDAGGLFKEWLLTLSKALFEPSRGLFQLSDSAKYLITRNSADTDLALYRLAGSTLAKALYDNIPINVPLAAPLYRQISGQKVRLLDLKEADSKLADSLAYIKFNPAVDLGYFAIETPTGTVELKPGGQNIAISDSNKREYVKLRKQWEVRGAVALQVESFLQGFHLVVSKHWLEPFSPKELEVLMCGQGDISVRDWAVATDYRGEFSKDHQVVQWFWETLGVFSQEDLRNLLQFSLGIERLPGEGFRAIRSFRGDNVQFTLQSIDFDPRRPHPRAHTCFNRLDLPLYASKEDLEKYLREALCYPLGFGLE